MKYVKHFLTIFFLILIYFVNAQNNYNVKRTIIELDTTLKFSTTINIDTGLVIIYFDKNKFTSCLKNVSHNTIRQNESDTLISYIEMNVHNDSLHFNQYMGNPRLKNFTNWYIAQSLDSGQVKIYSKSSRRFVTKILKKKINKKDYLSPKILGRKYLIYKTKELVFERIDLEFQYFL